MGFDVGQDFALDELPDGIASHFLLGAEELVEVIKIQILEYTRHIITPQNISYYPKSK
jgi:hypothetical protein